MDESQQIEAAAAVRLVVVLSPEVVDETAIRETLGDRSVRSLSQVAQAFGVAAATVRHTWRRDGMPGDAKAKRWPLSDILIWYLRRNEANSAARGADEFTQRKRDAETRTAEADARIREIRAKREEGDLVPRSEVQAGIVQFVAVCRDTLLGLPRRLLPIFPVRQAERYAGEIDREVRSTLAVMSEFSLDDVTGDDEHDRANGGKAAPKNGKIHGRGSRARAGRSRKKGG